jgi:hypothetical protein
MNPTSDPIEGALRRYRPSGPPATLRERVLAQDVPARVWPWAAAAAALLAVTLGAGGDAARIWTGLPAPPDALIGEFERRALGEAGVDDFTLRLIADERLRAAREHAPDAVRGLQP